MLPATFYGQTVLLYRNLLRGTAGDLAPSSLRQQAEALVGCALPGLRRRDAMRLGRQLGRPWRQVWQACGGERVRRPAESVPTCCRGFTLWECLPDGVRQALQREWPGVEGARTVEWEPTEEVEAIMREAPVGELAKVLAGKEA